MGAFFCQVPETFDCDPLLTYLVRKCLVTTLYSTPYQVRHVEELIIRHEVQDVRVHDVNATTDVEGQFRPLLNRADLPLFHLHDPVGHDVFMPTDTNSDVRSLPEVLGRSPQSLASS